MAYRLTITPAAEKDLAKLPQHVRDRVQPVLEALPDDPRPPQARALQGVPKQLRLRVGAYRVIYTVDDTAAEVLVLEIGHRSKVYRRFG